MPKRTETFLVNDGRSIRRLSKDGRQEENSAPAFCKTLVELLKKNGGVMTQNDIEAAFLKNYGKTFGPDDLRPIPVAKTGKTRPKWKNTLDWAKVLGRKSGLLATHSKRVEKKKVTYVVLLDADVTPQHWIEWAGKKKLRRTRKSFKKRCPNCRLYSTLSRKLCKECGHKFPPPADRIDRVPK